MEVSDSELIERLQEILSTSDLNTTTTTIVRRRLEEDFGVNLSDRKAFIREQVDEYLQSRIDGDDKEEEEIDGEAGIEEKDGGVEKESASGDGRCTSETRSTEKQVKKGGGGITKLCRLSPELQKFTGVPELARTGVVKQLWAYIKEHNLQDPSNRRSIVCDDTLRSLFGVDTIDMFQMNKAISNHVWPLDSDGPVPSEISKPKEKQAKHEREDQDEPKRKKKQQRVGNSNLLVPLKLSDALVKFLGTEEHALPRSDVVKKIWEYIKSNNLQDPSDKRQIICDEKLKELLNVDTFCGFTVTKLLTPHFAKTEQ